MTNTTVIITGANSGIGKAAAHLFAARGYRVVMACRNIERSIAVQNDIISATDNVQVDLLQVDMSSFDSIRSFCAEFREKYERADILIHNAAYFSHGAPYRLSPDNIELTFATNVFGPYLMTTLLLDHLKQSADARILNAGSNIIKHFFNPKISIDFGNLRGEDPHSKSFSVYRSYRDSKMALLMLTFRMAEEYQPLGIKVNMLQINGAKMSRETLKKFKPGWRLIAHLQNLFFPAPDVMAENYFDISTSDRFGDVTGKVINHKQEIMQPAEGNPGFISQFKQVAGAKVYPAYAHHQDVIDRVWRLCRELTQPQGN